MGENDVVLIHGSSVSGDCLPALERKGYELGSYVAGQSVISAVSDSLDPCREVWSTQLSSSSQQQSLLDDFRSSLLPELDSLFATLSGVLMDLVVERGGVWVNGSGQAISNTLELTTSKYLDRSQTDWAHHKFGAPRHIELWKDAFDRLLGHYRALGLDNRIIVIKSLWASESIEGDVFPFNESSLDPNIMNANYAPYFEHVERRLPGQILEIPPELCVTTRSHRWGIAPYHYIDETYEYVAERCLAMGSWVSVAKRGK